MEENKNRELILELRDLGYDYNELKCKTKEYLNSIYSFKRDKLNELNKLITEIEKSEITIAEAAKVLKISRTTIYQNSSLKAYIDEMNNEIYLMNPYNEINELKDEKIELEKTIEMMKKRDTELLVLKREIKELKAGNNKSNNLFSL